MLNFRDVSEILGASQAFDIKRKKNPHRAAHRRELNASRIDLEREVQPASSWELGECHAVDFWANNYSNPKWCFSKRIFPQKDPEFR